VSAALPRKVRVKYDKRTGSHPNQLKVGTIKTVVAEREARFVRLAGERVWRPIEDFEEMP